MLFFASFSRQRLLMVFHWSLKDIKSPQVSRTLFSILIDLNNAVVWMVSTCPQISQWPSCFIAFFSSLARSEYLSFFSFSLIFILWSTGTAIIIFFLLRVFHSSVSWWFFIGVWVAASLLKSPRLFSVFWPISARLYFEWSLLVLLFSNPPVPVQILL